MRQLWILLIFSFAACNNGSHMAHTVASQEKIKATSAVGACLHDMNTCDLQAAIQEKESEVRKTYQESESVEEKALSGLELQEWYMIQARMKDSKSVDIAQVHADYNVLREIEKVQASQESRGLVSGYEYPNEALPQPNFATPKDTFRVMHYHRKTAEDTAKVVADFGELYVRETPTNQMENIEIEYPGQGYFAPMREIKAQLAAKDGPYAKALRAIHYLHPEIPVEKIKADLAEIQNYELEKFMPGYELTAGSSEGFCHIRSLIDFEFETRKPRKVWKSPMVPGEENKFVELTSMDQFLIALASYTKAYRKNDAENMLLTYGTMYESGVETDGEGQGLKPESVLNILSHVLSGEIPEKLQSILGTGRMGAIVDTETHGTSKWNQPTFRLGKRIQRITQDTRLGQYAYECQAYMEYAKHLSKITDVPKPRHEGGSSTKKLSFWLYFNPTEPLKDGKRRIIGSSWTKESWVNHPNVIRLIPKDLVPRSHNEAFNKYLPLVSKELLIRKKKASASG